MGSNNIPAFKANTYYNWDNSDPDAIVLLNRGTEYELDLTNDIISFNTSNSIDSAQGTFTVTLDNKNDHLVNRFNNSRIKKMSSIEIFSKPLNSFGTRNNSTTSTTVAIPEDIFGKAPTLNGMFDLVYGKDISPDSRNYLIQQFNILNSDRVAPVKTGQIDKLSLKKKGILVKIVPEGNLTDCQITFVLDPSQPGRTSDAQLLIQNQKPITITSADKIIFDDVFYLKFTMNNVLVQTTLQNALQVSRL